MRTIAIVLAATALAACSNKAPEPPHGEMAKAQISAGTYNVTQADGSRMFTVLNANGSYTDTVDGAVTESGTWQSKDGGPTCFTPAESYGAKMQCYTVGEEAADGTFIATPDSGDPVKVRKIA